MNNNFHLISDCQKSGEFQSITSFYSSRRSFHSYPEDRHLFTSSNLPRNSQFLSDQPVSPANASYKADQKSSHLDTRVEGMEKTIKSLDRMVRKLRKQVCTKLLSLLLKYLFAITINARQPFFICIH